MCSMRQRRPRAVSPATIRSSRSARRRGRRGRSRAGTGSGGGREPLRLGPGREVVAVHLRTLPSMATRTTGPGPTPLRLEVRAEGLRRGRPHTRRPPRFCARSSSAFRRLRRRDRKRTFAPNAAGPSQGRRARAMFARPRPGGGIQSARAGGSGRAIDRAAGRRAPRAATSRSGGAARRSRGPVGAARPVLGRALAERCRAGAGARQRGPAGQAGRRARLRPRGPEHRRRPRRGRGARHGRLCRGARAPRPQCGGQRRLDRDRAGRLGHGRRACRARAVRPHAGRRCAPRSGSRVSRCC